MSEFFVVIVRGTSPSHLTLLHAFLRRRRGQAKGTGKERERERERKRERGSEREGERKRIIHERSFFVFLSYKKQ